MTKIMMKDTKAKTSIEYDDMKGSIYLTIPSGTTFAFKDASSVNLMLKFLQGYVDYRESTKGKKNIKRTNKGSLDVFSGVSITYNSISGPATLRTANGYTYNLGGVVAAKSMIEMLKKAKSDRKL